MQRIRPTEKGLQLTQGVGNLDLLTVERSITETYGDSVGFWLKGSLLNSDDIMRGLTYGKYSTFNVEGADNIADFAKYLPELNARETSLEDVEEFPEESQIFEEYTIDQYKVVGCIALETELIKARTNIDPELEELLDLLNPLIAIFEDLLNIEVGDVERVDTRAFAYPLGIRQNFQPVLLAEQSKDQLKLYFNGNSRERLPIKSVETFANWITKNSTTLKKKSVWG